MHMTTRGNDTHFLSLSSMANARTVRMLPKASSATPVAMAICSCDCRDHLLRIDPRTVPTAIIVGSATPMTTVICGEMRKREKTQPRT